MAGNAKRLFHSVAAQIDNVHGAVGLVGSVGAAAISERGNAGGIVSNGNGEGSSKGLTVVAEFVEADIDQSNCGAIVVGYDKLLGSGDVFGVYRSRNRRNIGTGQAGRSR